MPKNKFKKAFTLIELILVIAIIAILAAAIFVAIDPARRLHEARNARRSSDVATILESIKKYQVDNQGTHYTTIENMNFGIWYQIGTATNGCNISCGIETTDSVCVSLVSMGNNYLALIPQDPKTGTAAQTGYGILKGSNGAITITACAPEGEGAGGTGVVPAISVTR